MGLRVSIGSAVAPLLVALLAAACGQQPPPAEIRAAMAPLTGGDPACAGPTVHDVHAARFRCDTCHPTGATFGFDVPFTFAAGTTTAGGTLVRDATGTTCAVACHSPSGGTPAPVSWSEAGPLACVSCHAAAALPEAHPPVAASASREDCQACHLTDGHLGGSVAIRSHAPEWMDPGDGAFHARAANESFPTCRGCHGADLGGSAGVACGSCHDQALPAGTASWSVNCVMCHGGVDLASGAPPRTTWGNGADAVRSGAHTRHLTASAIAPAADCSACHATPADVFAAGHLDGGTAEVVFGRALPGRTQAWDRASATCSNTYCHAAVAGGTKPVPVWTNVGQGDAACGACHGLPPPAPHPSASGGLAGCVGCHALTMEAPGAIIAPASGGKHLNGAVEATGGHPAAFKDPASPGFHAFAANANLPSCQGCHGAALDGVGGSTQIACTTCHGADFTTRCTMCHGGVESASGAPPKATWGNAGDPARGGGIADPLRVGTHGKHLATTLTTSVTCGSCHVVPADALAPGHADHGDSLATVTWSGVALTGGATPQWNRSAGTCATTYCHGSYSGVFTYGIWDWGIEDLVFVSVPYAGKSATPGWTDGPLTCVSCHGNPPSGYWHGASHGSTATHRECQLCHPDATGANGSGGAAITDPSRHIDGTVDVTPQWGSGCNCH
jgi:predicted CxxxxCH...CXXCH cytochrome family protein